MIGCSQPEPMEFHPLKHFRLITGGADGVDRAAEELARTHGMQVEIVLGPNHPRAAFTTPLTPTQLQEADPWLEKVKKELNKTVTNPLTQELLQRNFHVVQRAHTLYAFGHLTSDKRHVEGGTGWSVEFAILLDKPIFLWDIGSAHWYRFDYSHKTFYATLPMLVPTLHPVSAIVGTRRINQHPGLHQRLQFLFTSTEKTKFFVKNNHAASCT